MPSKKKTTKKKSVKRSAPSRSVSVSSPAPRKSGRSMKTLGSVVVILLGITFVLLLLTYFSR